MIWRTLILFALMLGAMAAAKARADDGPGNPNALGTSRVLTVAPREFPRIGTAQYSQSLPLEDKEVVLTFDDGPPPPYTNRVLDVLAEHCVNADYFLVGRMARGYPDLTRRTLAEGHTVGTHSDNHLLGFDRAPMDTVHKPAMSTSAADSLARGDDVPRDPVRPFTSESKPARNMPTPGKFITTEPGGWPPVISVPVPKAGGVGVSSVTRRNQIADGRFH